MKVLADLEIQKYPEKVETVIAAAKGMIEVVRTRAFTSPEAGLYVLNALGFGVGRVVGQPNTLPVIGALGPCNDDTCDAVCDTLEQSLNAQHIAGQEPAEAIPWALIVQVALFLLNKFWKKEAV